MGTDKPISTRKKGGGPQVMDRWTFWGWGISDDEERKQMGLPPAKKNIMSNADRRRLGLPQDPDLEDFIR